MTKTLDLIDELLIIDDQLEALQAKRDDVAATILKRVAVGSSIENDFAKITVAQATTITVDFDALIAVKPRWASKVTRKVLDQAKFTLLRKAGQLPPEVVEILKENTSAAHLRITRK